MESEYTLLAHALSLITVVLVLGLDVEYPVVRSSRRPLHEAIERKSPRGNFSHCVFLRQLVDDPMIAHELSRRNQDL